MKDLSYVIRQCGKEKGMTQKQVAESDALPTVKETIVSIDDRIG